MSRKIFFAVSLLALVASWQPALAQTSAAEKGRLYATREELLELLRQHELSTSSTAYSPQLRARAQYEASLVRQRLEQGDFQVGDRIAVVVENEPALSDTMTVGSDLSVDLPSGERLSLRKVLRSEVQEKMEQAMAKVVKNPVVETQSFLRIGIMGAVGAQGFYVVRSEALLTDVLMNAGGLSQAAEMDKLRIERDRETIWEGDPLQQAITEGRTLDQLSIRAGDMIIVPQQSTGRNAFGLLRTAIYAVPALFALVRLLGNL